MRIQQWKAIFIIIFFTSTGQAKFNLESLLKKEGIDPSDVSAVFESNDAKRADLNPDQARIPASLTKIVTASAALDILPLNYKWESRLVANGVIQGSELKGDLCFYGGGNPNFLTEQLWVMANHFKRNNIKKVTGNLVVDESFFDNEYFDDKRMKKRVLRAYDSPVGGASFNWNSVNIYVRPGAGIGKKAQVFSDPENSYVELINDVSTSKSKTYINIEREVKKGVEVFRLKGRINLRSEEKVYYRPIKKPALWTGSNIKRVLGLVGTDIKGKVLAGKCKSNTRVLAAVKSKDLSLVVRDLMKFSNNFVAEVVAKTLVQYKQKKQGSMDEALKILDDYLKEKGSKKHVLFSVSGLSYYNKMTANSIMNLLSSAEQGFDKRAEFVASMPIAQIDGTLKSRFSTKYEGRVRAKTGLLNKVVGLAGYGQTDKSKRFRFVMIYNGTKKLASWKVRNAFDKIVMEYADAN